MGGCLSACLFDCFREGEERIGQFKKGGIRLDAKTSLKHPVLRALATRGRPSALPLPLVGFPARSLVKRVALLEADSVL